jgi:hypothetical protein
MKTVALISVAAMAALLSSHIQAGAWDNPDTADGILHALEQPGYVGTSLTDARTRVQIFRVIPGFPNHDVDETGYVLDQRGPASQYDNAYTPASIDPVAN